MGNPPDPAELGRAVEDAVADLCSGCFFPDYVIRSPKYKKAGGQEKEAADILAVFGNTLLALQVKTRILPAGVTNDLSAVEEKRLVRVLDHALDQFRALLEAWSDPKFGQFTNERGLPLRFEKKGSKRLVMIMVYAVLGNDGTKPEFNLRCSKSCYTDWSVAVHVFSFFELKALLLFSDTLPDFLNFLDVREALHGSGLISDLADPIDVWTLAAFEKERLLSALERKSPLTIDGLMNQHQSSVAELEEAEKESYLIDWIMRELHEGIDRSRNWTGFDAELPPELAPPGSVAAYQITLPYLARLNRKERGQLARELNIRAERSRDGNLSFGGLKFADHGEGYLVASVPGPRTERLGPVAVIGQAFAYRSGLNRVVCIGTGPNGPKKDECEVFLVQIDRSKPSGEMARLAARWFGPARES